MRRGRCFAAFYKDKRGEKYCIMEDNQRKTFKIISRKRRKTITKKNAKTQTSTIYYGQTLKKVRKSVPGEKSKKRTVLETDQTKKLNLKKNYVATTSQYQRKNPRNANQPITVTKLENQLEYYIHSNPNIEKKIISKNFKRIVDSHQRQALIYGRQNAQNFIEQTVKKAKADYLRLFAESQGSASAKEGLTKFFNTIENKSGETNIDEFFRLIDEAILKGIDLAAMMDARNFYATKTKTLGAKTSVFKAIQNGSGEALFKFLKDIDEIYKKLSNSEQSITGALGITTFLKNQVVTETSTFSMKLLYRLSKFLENQKIESGLVFLQARKILKNFFAALSTKKTLPFSKQIKLNLISKTFAELCLHQIQQEAEKKLTQQIDNKIEMKNKTRIFKIDNTQGSKTVNNPEHIKKKIFSTTDVKATLETDTIFFEKGLKIDIGLSLKFYQGLINKHSSNGTKGSYLNISTGGRGSLKQLIHTLIQQDGIKEYFLYNYITWASLKDDRWARFNDYVVNRYFIRLIATGGTLIEKYKNSDLSSFIIINGVPFAVWDLLKELENGNNNLTQIITLTYNNQVRPIFNYQNQWSPVKAGDTEGTNRDILHALMRSHRTYSSINGTYIKSKLHLNHLNSLIQQIILKKSNEEDLIKNAILSV